MIQPNRVPNMTESLDAEELLMLGLRASAEGAGGDALTYLKRAIEKRPDDARAHWALAAEYASLRMPDRARDHFARSLEIDPAPPVARFQFGLLMLTQGDAAQAQAIWGPLDALDASAPVRLFKNGLLHMAGDRFDDALAEIRRAMSAPGVDPAMRRDMEMVVANIETSQRSAASADAVPASPAEAGKTRQDEPSIESQLALHAYRSGVDDNNRH
jgi:tetratricopeptide (TPR) repeat protein